MFTLLGRLPVLGLGLKPIIYIDNELLGPIPLQQPLKILFSGSLGRKEDFNVTIVALCSLHPTSPREDTFLTAQGTLLVLWHLRCAFIKSLRLLVPHVLRRDANPTADVFVGYRTGIFPLLTPSLI